MIVKKVGTQAPNEGIQKSLRDLAIQKMNTNSDGFFVNNPKNELTIRTMNQREAEAVLGVADVDGMMVHARIATMGVKTELNVHGWEIGDYIFAHNGAVRGYVSDRHWDYDKKEMVDTVDNGGKSDSLLLFEDLQKILSHTGKSNKKIAFSIRKAIDGKQFWGRAMLYHKPSDRMFIFGDWHVYLISQQYLLISSSHINFDLQGEKKLYTHGMTFDIKPAGIAHQTYDGVGVISNFKQSNFQFKSLGDLRTWPIRPVNTPAAKPATPTAEPKNYSTDQDHDGYIDRQFPGYFPRHSHSRNDIGFHSTPAVAPEKTTNRKSSFVVNQPALDRLHNKLLQGVPVKKPDTTVKEELTAADEWEMDDKRFIERMNEDLNDVPVRTYHMMDAEGNVVEVFLDAVDGYIHDVNGVCCEMKTCGDFYEIIQARTEIHHEPLPF